MNRKQSQKGSSHLTLIIILVIAVLGGLSFAYWRNFMQPKAADNTPAPAVIEKVVDNTPVPVADDGKKTISIAEWGVKGKYTNDEVVTYLIMDNYAYGSDSVKIYSDSFPNNSTTTDCGGFISRLTANDKMAPSDQTIEQYYAYQQANLVVHGPVTKKVGEFYYHYTTPQVSCVKSSTDPLNIAELSITKVIEEVVLSLEAI